MGIRGIRPRDVDEWRGLPDQAGQPRRDFVEVAVTDTGSGIAPDLVGHLFDRFAKSADSRGSGLGLAIARHLVEAHGGQISAGTSPGPGTTIRFSLPIDG